MVMFTHPITWMTVLALLHKFSDFITSHLLWIYSLIQGHFAFTSQYNSLSDSAAMAAIAEKVMAAVKEWLPAEEVSSVDDGGSSRICGCSSSSSSRRGRSTDHQK